MQNCTKLSVVYWIRKDTHTDPYTEGYIGVTQDFKRRCRDHKAGARSNRHPNAHLGRAIRKYANTLVYEILYLGNREICFSLEEKFRPVPSIGWNLMSGGSIGKITEEGKRTLSRKMKGRKYSKNAALLIRWKSYKTRNSSEISLKDFKDLLAIRNKEVPPSKAKLKVFNVLNPTIYRNIAEASKALDIDPFILYNELESGTSNLIYYKYLHKL